MDKCIHPLCGCKAYKEPAGTKGTLLQLKAGCQACGHQASLHRKLTSIDCYIGDEVKKAKKEACCHLIPTREIPRSPLFEPYDLIPLPSDDQCTNEDNEEGGVQCTCKGFECDLVRLWQKFRTHNLDHVTAELPKATCSFCRHPLSEHSAAKSDSNKATPPPLRAEHAQSTLRNMYGQLSLKASTNIALPVALGNGVAVQLPTRADDCRKMQSVLITKVGNKELELSLLTHDLKKIETKPETDIVVLESEIPVKNCNGTETLPVCTTRVAGANGATAQDAVSVEVGGKSRATKKGQKRKSSESTSPEPKRRSSRIAEMKKKDEKTEKNQKWWIDETLMTKKKKRKSKLVALLEERNHSESELLKTAMTKRLSESEVKYLNGNAVEFVQSFCKETSFRSCGKLPQAIPPESHVLLATHPVNIHNSREGRGTAHPSPPADLLSLTLVAVASQDTHEVYVAPLMSEEAISWTSLSRNFASSASVKVTSLSWMSATEESVFDAYLSVGCSDGSLSLWQVNLLFTSPAHCCVNEVCLLICVEDTRDQITACDWSPDGKTLAAGTISGDVLFYTVKLEAAAADESVLPPSGKNAALKHMQTAAHVCGGSVRCLTWSKDSRLVAVGGSDDHIQILQCREPNVSESKPISASSLLNYFEVDDKATRHKFVHTHSLRGHQSFIADLCFLGHGHCLVSIGWDSQLLLWSRLLLPTLPKACSSSRAVHHNTPHVEQSAVSLPLTEVEPMEGFKLGPSASVDFLPLCVCNYLDYGLFILIGETGDEAKLHWLSLRNCLSKLHKVGVVAQEYQSV